jgi:hypothetical protein
VWRATTKSVIRVWTTFDHTSFSIINVTGVVCTGRLNNDNTKAALFFAMYMKGTKYVVTTCVYNDCVSIRCDIVRFRDALFEQPQQFYCAYYPE